MTAVAIQAGAPSAVKLSWETIEWKQVVKHVRQLQMRIAKACKEGKHGKAKALQWILTHSFYAKLLAVKRVTSNKGARTPGTDGVTWRTPNQKMRAAVTLKRRGYKTKPLKRIYIPKKQKGKLRPLSIPTIGCRAQQALHLLSLEPIAEIKADKNAYGFRPLRSTADATEKIFSILSRRCAPRHVLEGDIRACFDCISHQWLQNNVPMDKKMLGKWLAAGYIEDGKLLPTKEGTPQGGIISPTLLNVTLSGLEAAIKVVSEKHDKVNVVVYADDFIITGATKEVLENKVKPAIDAFLGERGLSLSQEKTKITYITEGFDFLGMNIRKYRDEKLIIKPAKASVKSFLFSIRETIKGNATAKTVNLIHQLNSKIKGWANYYRHVCSKETFNYIEHQIFKALWRWAVRRHPNKGAGWVKQKYFHSDLYNNWVFFAREKQKDGNILEFNIARISKVTIKRHIKIRAAATPYDAAYHSYFEELLTKRKRVMESCSPISWWLCWWRLFKPSKPGSFYGAL